MESKQQVTIPPVDHGKRKANKGVVVLLVIIVLVLGAAVGVMLSKLNDQKKEAAEVQDILETQKKILEDDLTDLQGQFGELKTNNDSLLNLASGQQERITKLLAIQADNAYKIRTYQKELETLRGVLKSYIIQVDSLDQRNKLLTAQNTELARNLASERTQSARLTQERERLTSTVQKAQVLSVSDIITTGLTSNNRREVITDRARNVDKLKTCFTLRENQVAAAGERTIYLVIIKSDKKVLVNNANATFTTSEGGEIVYTDMRAIDYENEDVEPCIYTDNNGRITVGKYEVNVYCDGYLAGTSTFVLR